LDLHFHPPKKCWSLIGLDQEQSF